MEITDNEMQLVKGLAYKVWEKSFSYISQDDLVQEGILALLKMKKTYDPKKNDNFIGFAYKRIRGAMLDYVAAQSIYKYRTVRSKYSKDDIKLTSTPENVELFHYIESFEDDLLVEMEREEAYKMFSEYINDLTELEQYILYSYFVSNTTMKQIAEDLGMQRVKVKTVIVNCINYLRRRFGLSEQDNYDLKRW